MTLVVLTIKTLAIPAGLHGDSSPSVEGEPHPNYGDSLPTQGAPLPPAKKATRSTKKTGARKISPAKKSTKRATKKRTAAKRSGPRKMSAAHKQALADGRNMSATV